MNRYDRILGGLLGAAIGDAMGAATETRPTEYIIEKFGGLVKDFIAPPEDVFAHGFPVGAVTDDFSLAYCTGEAIIAAGGKVTEQVGIDALINWSKTPYICMAGPTTIATIDRLQGKEVATKYPFLAVDNSKGSNGSAMKIGPVALISGGDVDKAIADSLTICKITHGNSLALAGGCATAAAVAKAMQEGSTIYDLVEAGLKGAKEGEEAGIKMGKMLAGASVYKRINLAVEIALRKNDLYETMYELEDIIGGGLAANEAVPCAFGLMVASKGDPYEAIYGGVNIGNDTDTVATIAGSMIGTLAGGSAFKKEHLDLINSANSYDLEAMAKKYDELIG